MTKKEREIIKYCIQQLMDEEGNFAFAIWQLGKLIGIEYPAGNPNVQLPPPTRISINKEDKP